MSQCRDCGQAHDPDIRCPNFHAGMHPTDPDPVDKAASVLRARYELFRMARKRFESPNRRPITVWEGLAGVAVAVAIGALIGMALDD